jgi:hypothetical protein
MTPAITVEAGVSPALFRDSQPARLPLPLTGKPVLQRKSEKHKNVATVLRLWYKSRSNFAQTTISPGRTRMNPRITSIIKSAAICHAQYCRF